MILAIWQARVVPMLLSQIVPLSFSERARVVTEADSATHLAQIDSASQGEVPYFPDSHCDNENLIKPANWSRL